MRSGRDIVVRGGVILLVLFAAHGRGETAPPPAAEGSKRTQTQAQAAPGDATKEAAQRLAALRRKILKDEDFVDNNDINRDPFQSYLRLFVDKSTVKTRKVPAIFEKFGLEELSLIAIVTGDPDPRAMFRDPTGLGQAVKKGDYLSKSAVRVTKILSDRVIVEVMETTASGAPRPVEKAIQVNPEENRP
jgi:Tfp pilus assembly protein PilP